MAGTLGKYKIPRPMQDEDKWFRYFTKRQLIYVGISLVIMARLIFWVKDYKPFIQIPVLTLGCIVVIVSTVFGMVNMPDDRYLWGGGTSLEKLAVRLFRRKLRSNRVLYVRNYRPVEPETAEKRAVKEKVGDLVARNNK